MTTWLLIDMVDARPGKDWSYETRFFLIRLLALSIAHCVWILRGADLPPFICFVAAIVIGRSKPCVTSNSARLSSSLDYDVAPLWFPQARPAMRSSHSNSLSMGMRGM